MKKAIAIIIIGILSITGVSLAVKDEPQLKKEEAKMTQPKEEPVEVPPVSPAVEEAPKTVQARVVDTCPTDKAAALASKQQVVDSLRAQYNSLEETVKRENGMAFWRSVLPHRQRIVQEQLFFGSLS